MSQLNIDEAVKLIEEFGPNCFLGICCPPAQQTEVLAAAVYNGDAGVSVSREDCKKLAEWLLARFDLAPKDSITPLLRKAGQLATER